MTFTHGKPSDKFLESAAQISVDTAGAGWPLQSMWHSSAPVAMAMSALTSLSRIAAVLERLEDRP